MLRFHTQTGGATLTAQQPENNIVRTALEALAAVLGGTQSLHTNSFDEALALPTEQAAKIALRTQQVIGYETGVRDTVDPLGGSYFVESLTDELERARVGVPREDRRGWAARSRRSRPASTRTRSHEAAFRIQQGIESGERVVVGREPVRGRRGATGASSRRSARRRSRGRSSGSARSGPRATRRAVGRGRSPRSRRPPAGPATCCPPMKEALRARATLGEVSDVLRGVFGEYHPH